MYLKKSDAWKLVRLFGLSFFASILSSGSYSTVAADSYCIGCGWVRNPDGGGFVACVGSPYGSGICWTESGTCYAQGVCK